MGYNTVFYGEFKLDKPLDSDLKKYLTKFSDSRRVKRDLPPEYGVDGEFYVDEGKPETVINYNKPPATQPSLWCGWTPSDDGSSIVWNEVEKFYYYKEWLVYIMQKILAPKGYTLNGKVSYEGEDVGDSGCLVVKDNILYIQETLQVLSEPEMYQTTLCKNQNLFQLDTQFEKVILS